MLKRLMLFTSTTLCLLFSAQMVAEVLEGPRGPVEFIGLEDWTASDLFNAIKEINPDKPFHACAADLTQSLEFPEAAAFGFFENQEDGSQKMYTVVVGVEDGTFIRYGKSGTDSLDLPEIWQELQTVAEEDFGTVATIAYVRFLMAEPDTARQLAEMSEEEAKESAHEFAVMFGANAESIDEVWPLFDVFENTIDEEDHELALEVLVKDQSWSARMSATIILSSFPKHDASWHGLAKSLIDPAVQVRDVASKLLQGLIRAGKTDPVDWTQARETLLALLGGTNPWAFNEVLKVLVATEIKPNFGLKLAKERPKLLLAFSGAQHEKTRTPAQDFLKAISGEDFEQDVKAWADWIKESESVP